jgi:sulfite reductase (NADPH) flavoprotein alpha-component
MKTKYSREKMLADVKLKVLEELIRHSSKEELIWMNGYLNGIVRNEAATTLATVPTTTGAPKKITIVYGTETGNSKKLAVNFAAKAKQSRIAAKVVALDQYKPEELTKEEYLLAVISTHGDGEPPAAAKNFYDHIHRNGFRLPKLKYSVLALGDTSYPLFCKTGEDVDVQLNKLGGNRISPLQKCDIDYDADAERWFNDVLNKLATNTTTGTTSPVVAAPIKKGKQQYTGTVTNNINLNDVGSNKATFHIEIAAGDVEYACGDSIGIIPENDSELVTAIIAITNADGNKTVEFKKERYAIYELLKRKINIVHLTERLVKLYATATGHSIPDGRYDLIELLQKYPVSNTKQFEEILVTLNALAPRLYTIASAPSAHEQEVHITVVKDIFYKAERKQYGLCSAYLADFAPGRNINFFVQPNKHFKLPASDKDIIMVGPGTGIAAFRSFLAERDATAAAGRNWLFFGEQHFTTDFLYQTEIQNWFATGVLTKLSTAFSRDQQEKIYVQHKLLQHAAEVYEWINSGAGFYVCGKKNPMSTDVEDALLQIIQEQGKKTVDEARQYLQQMEDEGRYEKDVY